MFKSYNFNSGIAGPHILVLGAVHGNETAGTQAQRELINQINQGSIRLKSGQITFVPVVNEAAYKKNCRSIDINLNRVIRYHSAPQNNEEKIANSLIRLIDQCDIMLDLHSTHCPKDVEFAFIDYPNAKNLELLSLVPVKTALAGWPQIYMGHPEITNFCTEEYAHSRGKTGITVECGYHKSPHAVKVAKQSILNVLSHFGNIDMPVQQTHLPRTISLQSFVNKQGEGKMSKNYQHLDRITTGETIAVYNNGQKITAPFDGYIIMPNHEAPVGAEWFYFGK